MDFGVALRAAYLDRFFAADAPPVVEYVDAKTASLLLYACIMKLRSRIRAALDLDATEAFDEEADRALEKLAATGAFSAWDNISAGAWAALADRMAWSLTCLQLPIEPTRAFKMGLPKDAPEDVREMATLLWLLGGPGRRPPEQWRRAKSSENRSILLNSSFSRQ